MIADAACSPKRLVAFEPEPRNPGFLHLNVNEGDVDAKIEPIAVINTTSDVTNWNTNEDIESGYIAKKATQTPSQETVHSIKPSDYLDQHGPDQVDLLKIDVERAEGRVLSGLGGVCDRIQGVTIKLHTSQLIDFDDRPVTIVTTLIGQGYELIYLDNAETTEYIDRAQPEQTDVASKMEMSPRTVYIILAVRPETDIHDRTPDNLSSVIKTPIRKNRNK